MTIIQVSIRLLDITSSRPGILPWRSELTGNVVGDILALYGSSFFLIPLIAQSNVENKPPQTPKFPPSTGARAFIAVRAPILRSPYGELRKPFTPCQTAPPIAYSTGHVSVCVICGGEDGADARCDVALAGQAPGHERGTGNMDGGVHTPIQNAPPKSFSATQGQGSRV